MTTAMSLSNLFIAYVALVAAVVAITLARTLSARATLTGLIGLALWLGYAGALGYLGVVGDTTLRFPGIFILMTPIIAFVSLVLVRSPVGRHLATSVPLGLLIGLQVFRVGVELTLHRLWELGSVPKLMTLAGGNFEILVGFSAPVFALIATRGPSGRRVALLWNVVGLASLLNVAARAVLSAPGPLNFLHGEVLNTALGTFPFTFIPGFMAPLAMMLHVLTFRSLRAAGRSDALDVNAAAAALG